MINTSGEDHTFYIYFEVPQPASTDLVLFNELAIPGAWTNQQIAALQGMKIDISAYAVQEAGMTDVFAAFAAGNAANWAA